MQAPLGLAVIGGLVMSTFATLLVLPSVFAIVIGARAARSASISPEDSRKLVFRPRVFPPLVRPARMIPLPRKTTRPTTRARAGAGVRRALESPPPTRRSLIYRRNDDDPRPLARAGLAKAGSIPGSPGSLPDGRDYAKYQIAPLLEVEGLTRTRVGPIKNKFIPKRLGVRDDG